MLNTPKWIIVHHTGGTESNALADTSEHTIEVVRSYHKSLGWEDIGYHFFIEKDGSLKIGRAENYHGAHTLGHNNDSLGVCMAGNFDLSVPTTPQIQTLIKLLLELKQKYNIPLENIVPHRKFAQKTCYGKHLHDTWAQEILQPIDLKAEILKTLQHLNILISNLK